jgi:DNA-binding GntR family transcriptional regulator
MKVPLPKATGGGVLKDWVGASLREAILQGYFKPGEKLDQDLIAEELDVSRTPVREAVMALEAEGFVEVRPRRGAFVVTLSRQDIRDICEVRGLLEAEAVRQVTPQIPESVLEEVEWSLDETQARFEAGDVGGHFESDVFFHETIISLAENELLQEILGSLTNRIARLRKFAQLQPGQHLVESFVEHRTILQAMRRRDAEAAAEAMRVHLHNSALRLQEFVPREAGQPETS